MHFFSQMVWGQVVFNPMQFCFQVFYFYEKLKKRRQKNSGALSKLPCEAQFGNLT